jgi:hypothetical protein
MWNTEWLAPTGPSHTLRRNHRVDVSIDTKTFPGKGKAHAYDEEGIVPPRYIPAWVLPQVDLNNLMAEGAGAALNIIYARGVPVDPNSDPDSFDRKDCSLVLFEIGFCTDLGLQDKFTKKTENYQPLLRALRWYWGRVDLVCIPIGHARGHHFTRHNNRHRDRPRQDPPSIRRPTKPDRPQNERGKQDRPHPRHTDREDCTLQNLLPSPNPPLQHNGT